MDIHGEEDESYNAKADVMRGRGVRHLLALITKGGEGLRQMLILADIRGRGVWTPHFWFTYDKVSAIVEVSLPRAACFVIQGVPYI